MIELIERFELSDIWRIRNPTEKPFTFCQNHISGYIQRRLDYFFVSNKLEESIKNTNILVSFSTDHYPISFTLRISQIVANHTDRVHKILKNADDIRNKNIIIGRDFNLHFNPELEAKGGKSTLKKSIRKMIGVVECFELCGICRI